jgi:hypothetical protein
MRVKFFLVASVFFLFICGCSNNQHNTKIISEKPPLSVITQIGNNGTNQTDNKVFNQNVGDAFCKNALNPLKIETYDGSGQAMHPKVLYFDTPWNGWKYWMSYTPYPNGKGDFENPSVAVSQDGLDWHIPKGLKNPIIKPPSDAGRGGHYSDPHIVMNEHSMEMWYRYNPANNKNNKINRIYMVTSMNGVSWASPKLILNDQYKYFSPAVLYENGVYKMWFSDTDGKLHYRESNNLTTWSAVETVNLELNGYRTWHQDVIHTQGGYETIFSAFKNGEFSLNNQQLYYSISPDGINFGKPVLILSPSSEKNQLDNQMIYRSSLLKVNGAYKIFYSAMNKNRQWHIFQTDINFDKAHTII